MAIANSKRIYACAHCGSEFTGRKKRFCSAKCRVAFQNGHDPSGHECAHCGARFTGRKKKYCSEECAREAKHHRDLIVRHLRRNHGPITAIERERLYSEFIESHGSWPAYMESRPGHKYYRSPLYKRIYRFRRARKQGRNQNYRPLPGERPIWKAHQDRVSAWKKYLAKCEWIAAGTWPNNPNTTPAYPMTDDQKRQSIAREWKWRYRNDTEFRAKEKARLFKQKQWRRYQQEVTDDGTVGPELIDRRATCLYCGVKLTKKNRTLDHMDPLKLGGHHSASNVTECCKSCNSRKNAKPFIDWLDELDEPHRSRAEREYVRLHGGPVQQASLFAGGCHLTVF